MKRRLLIGLLAVGTLAGFGSGFFHMGARAHARRAAFEAHVADLCVESAIRTSLRGEPGHGPPRER